ncbi:MAG: UDP-N-acetylglucosamine--N-acetylmuramyl-(pentapeptide) pyrophosphoryl-undecaprenol N-acetylglucosamine transferase, partial [Clostridia bacterium]|nr:UDP-N-acetylglucosamine--N-acetylmuramyl-(pentapeptide) pyrophosphoryl-undecaprenol N-acetylglucosamine transferase [Clostridia bacterium]
GFNFETIEIRGFKRSFSPKALMDNVKTVGMLLKSSSQVKKIIEKFRPDVVVGFGGYVSGPVLKVACKMGIPTAIHEQNAYPGVTNKALAKTVDRVMLTVMDAKKHMSPKNEPIYTGLPVRGELIKADRELSRAELNLDDRPLVLSMGGSLGARAINDAMVETISSMHRDADCYFLHATGQYGKWVPDKLREKGVDLENEKHIIVREYIDDMARCLSAADLVICRAGASSLSEFQVMGKPSILIPSPNVAENHQYHNAMALVNNNAAVIIEEKDLSGETLTKAVKELIFNPDRLAEIGANAKKMAICDATDRIIEVISEIIK